MRTTIDIPDHLFRRAKAAASLDGKSLKTFVTEAVESKVADSIGIETSRKRTTFPLVQSKAPGSIQIDGLAVADTLEAEDTSAPGRH